MKKTQIIIVFFVIMSGTVHSQTSDSGSFRIGFHLRELAGDFGLGLNLDLPTPQNWPTIRLAGTWQWQEIPEGTSFDKASYLTLRAGVASKSFQIQERIRAYGEGGLLGVLPSDELSENSFELGGYGLFGFEFFVEQYGLSSLFLEVGASSAGNGLETRPGVPSFGTGFWVGAGFRVAL
ncbi:MAG: hypothetical protein WBM56_13720 [Robiginitalea sp.]|uniref:hypothetical protein n=1 Tax=Robiginitalea sp. TaxID=1902411 RepID=UPI003C75105E